jgi:mRNA interferase RelE/StbE
MTYAVEILRTAQRQFAKIDRQAQGHIIDSIRALATDPRPSGCKKLSGRPAWRIRVGDYRVI